MYYRVVKILNKNKGQQKTTGDQKQCLHLTNVNFPSLERQVPSH